MRVPPRSPADALPLLQERISRLDAEPIYADRHGRNDPDLAHFIRTMQAVIRPGVVADRRLLPQTSAVAADRMTASCRLLQRLSARAHQVANGPIDRADQYWVASGAPAHLPPRSPTLDRGRFVEATRVAHATWSSKPFGIGLYTSTGIAGSFGMWWNLLDLNRGSTLTPLPWSVWSLRVTETARVVEIRSASDWVGFVDRYHVTRDGSLYPEWARVAADWDGVHMTLRAIVATQGIWFPVGESMAAAPYWDVESTLWLRWVFSDQRLVHVEPEP